MSDERITVPVQPMQSETSAPPTVAPAPITRRMVLRGASAAMPAILTLQSGAVLANASNGMLSGSSGSCGNGQTVPVDGIGNYSPGGTPHYACLETGGVPAGPYKFVDGNPLKLIPADAKFQGSNTGCAENQAYGDDLCRTGETYKYPAGSSTQVDKAVPPGMLLSAIAYSSIAAAGVIDPQFLDL